MTGRQNTLLHATACPPRVRRTLARIEEHLDARIPLSRSFSISSFRVFRVFRSSTSFSRLKGSKKNNRDRSRGYVAKIASRRGAPVGQ